jgi:hypothetical protein
MAAQTGKQPDHFEQLKQMLDDAPMSHEFLSEYVGELKKLRSEEDIFTRFAFRNVGIGGAEGRGDVHLVSADSELYKPLSPGRQVEIRRWWHEKMRSAANHFADLKERLNRG